MQNNSMVRNLETALPRLAMIGLLGLVGCTEKPTSNWTPPPRFAPHPPSWMHGEWEFDSSASGTITVVAKANSLTVRVFSYGSPSSDGAPALGASITYDFGSYDAPDYQEEIGTDSYKITPTRFPSSAYLFTSTGSSSLQYTYPYRSGTATASLAKQVQ